MKRATRSYHSVLLAGIAAVALSPPAMAWDYSTPTPPPSDPPTTITNSPAGGAGGTSHASNGATAGSPRHAAMSLCSASSSA